MAARAGLEAFHSRNVGDWILPEAPAPYLGFSGVEAHDKTLRLLERARLLHDTTDLIPLWSETDALMKELLPQWQHLKKRAEERKRDEWSRLIMTGFFLTTAGGLWTVAQNDSCAKFYGPAAILSLFFMSRVVDYFIDIQDSSYDNVVEERQRFFLQKHLEMLQLIASKVNLIALSVVCSSLFSNYREPVDSSR